jgi:hypothetical protein
MRKILPPFLYVIIVFSFLSCSNSHQTIPITEIIIDSKNEVDISRSLTTEYFKSRKLVKLETTDESLITLINRLIVYDNKYYIFDQQNKSIFVFDESGKYISKIHNIGKGPGEYIQLTDFTIDTKNKQIILLCDIPSCLIYYDLNGKYLNQKKNEKLIKYISAGQNSIFFVNFLITYNENYIGIQNESKYSEFLPVEDYIKNKDFYSFHPNIIRSDYTYFLKVYDDLVYELSDDNVVPKYQIVFGGKAIDKNIIKENELEKILEISSKEKLICRINDFRECDNYLMFGMYPYNKIAIYNKNEKVCRLFSGFYDPETGLYLSGYIAYDGPGDEMMFIVDPTSFVSNVLHIRKSKEAAQNKTYIRFKEEAEKLTDTDNPILMVYTLK